MFDRDSRTEKPTPRRREQAREKGSVARSQDLNSAVLLFGAALTLTWLGGGIVTGLGEILSSLLRRAGKSELNMQLARDLATYETLEVAKVLLPFLLALMAFGLAVNVTQVGFRVSWKAAAPNWSRLNPLSGFKRFFSVRALVELAKSLLKLFFVGLILYFTLKSAALESSWLFFMPKEQLLPEMGRKLNDLFRAAAMVLLAIGLLDFVYQRYDHEQSLKMTKEEVKEEAKQQEGDPKVKGKIREIMIRSTLKRMMKNIPEADVVITNPTHIAVALKYDREKSSAPVVVAKGARKVAERIKEIAAEHGVPIVENKPLARTLFKSVDVGMEIPVELYKAVAEILAYVYRIKNRYFGVA
ncbi:MAG: flagellar biosynthesis protein FlhB [Calditrichaeota bacterium]|nr:flagellar biosynthesis protein FlhB [Calditrichota bacterium]